MSQANLICSFLRNEDSLLDIGLVDESPLEQFVKIFGNLSCFLGRSNICAHELQIRVDSILLVDLAIFGSRLVINAFFDFSVHFGLHVLETLEISEPAVSRQLLSRGPSKNKNTCRRRKHARLIRIWICYPCGKSLVMTLLSVETGLNLLAMELVDFVVIVCLASQGMIYHKSPGLA